MEWIKDKRQTFARLDSNKETGRSLSTVVPIMCIMFQKQGPRAVCQGSGPDFPCAPGAPILVALLTLPGVSLSFLWHQHSSL